MTDINEKYIRKLKMAIARGSTWSLTKHSWFLFAWHRKGNIFNFCERWINKTVLFSLKTKMTDFARMNFCNRHASYSSENDVMVFTVERLCIPNHSGFKLVDRGAAMPISS